MDSMLSCSRAHQCVLQVYTSVEQALPHCDAVVLMVPHDQHEPLTLKCLQAGKHVLLEKPVAHTLESCLSLQQAANDASTVLMVGENSIHWPEVCIG